MNSFCRGAAVVLFGILLGVTCSLRGAAPPVLALPVVCPALDRDWNSEPAPYSMFGIGFMHRRPVLPVELVVLGTVKASSAAKSAKHEIQVEKVLFGAFTGKRLTITDMEGETGRGIFALSREPSAITPTFVLRRRHSAHEEKAARAPYRTELEYAALAGEILFVGKNVAVRGGGLAVEVQRVLRGPASLRGRQLSIQLSASLRDGSISVLPLSTRLDRPPRGGSLVRPFAVGTTHLQGVALGPRGGGGGHSCPARPESSLSGPCLRLSRQASALQGTHTGRHRR